MPPPAPQASRGGTAATLEEASSGELHEPAAVPVPAALKLAASEVGVSVSLAVAVVAERALVAREVPLDRELVLLLVVRMRLEGRRTELEGLFLALED